VLHGPVFGEFLGTMVLLIFGDGVVANVLLAKSKGENSGWIVIATGWGLAVFCGIITSLGVGGVAHLNPAITLAAAIGKGDYSILLPYWAAQMAGAFVAGVFVYLFYLPHWQFTKDQGLKLAVFCTAPAVRNLPLNALTEFMGTFILVMVGFTIGSRGVAGSSAGLPAGLSPYLWGVFIWAIGLSLGGPTGYAINPARDLGPRIAHAVLPIPGKGGSDWGYAAVPVLAPLAGGAVGALAVLAFGIS
jgi:glycerol uptake facilitator protein